MLATEIIQQLEDAGLSFKKYTVFESDYLLVFSPKFALNIYSDGLVLCETRDGIRFFHEFEFSDLPEIINTIQSRLACPTCGGTGYPPAKTGQVCVGSSCLKCSGSGFTE